MSHLPSALAALAKGFHIFPVEPNGKTPIRIYQDRPEADAPWTIKWSEVATNDPAKILEWWAWCPTANIGIACAPSGLLVVDCDIAKSDNNLAKDQRFAHLHETCGPRVDGEIVYDQVACKFGPTHGRTYNWAEEEAFHTYQVRTRSGGLHLYYRWPHGVKASQASIVRGIVDIRCNGGERGGYVLAPGSIIDGNAYVEENQLDIKPAMPWLVELCREKPKLAQPLGATADVIRQPRNQNFSGLTETIRLAPDGNLNNALFWAARAMCNDGGSEAACVELMAPEYVSLGGRGGWRQAEATIRSAYRNQQRKAGS